MDNVITGLSDSIGWFLWVIYDIFRSVAPQVLIIMVFVVIAFLFVGLAHLIKMAVDKGE